jgi:hypothetical protein
MSASLDARGISVVSAQCVISEPDMGLKFFAHFSCARLAALRPWGGWFGGVGGSVQCLGFRVQGCSVWGTKLGVSDVGYMAKLNGSPGSRV